jgi:hypothetical protein
MVKKSRATHLQSQGLTLVAAVVMGIAVIPSEALSLPIMGYVNEQNFLEFTIHHHFSALRATELAAGTAMVGSSSNFAGSPESFPPSPQKATNSLVLDIAIEANASQRSDILMVQDFLNVYYGIPNYPPIILPSNQAMLDMLEATPPGDPFNIAFLQMFIEHHLEILPAAQECASVAPHADVRSMCSTMVSMQGEEIALMRAELRDTYEITNTVPEPGSISLVLAGLIGLIGFGCLSTYPLGATADLFAFCRLDSPQNKFS